jgi:hypothetical protein
VEGIGTHAEAMNEGPAPVGGVVRDAAGAPVALVRISFTRGPVPLPDIVALTDVRGRFVLSAPIPGQYEISGISDEAGRTSVTVDVPPQGIQEIELRLGG